MIQPERFNVNRYDPGITVDPDGTNVPNGSGSNDNTDVKDQYIKTSLAALKNTLSLLPL